MTKRTLGGFLTSVSGSPLHFDPQPNFCIDPNLPELDSWKTPSRLSKHVSHQLFAHLHRHTGHNIKSLAYLQLLSIAKVDLATKGAESVHGRTMRDELGSKLNIADNG